MAVQQLQIPTSNINNAVDQSVWAGLGNLGNVYQEAQAQRRRQTALASLGTDPVANAQVLMTSQDPQLAMAGINMQSAERDRTERIREYEKNYALQAAQDKRAEAAEARAQGNYEKADRDEAAAADLIKQLAGGAGGAATPPSDVFRTGAPPIAGATPLAALGGLAPQPQQPAPFNVPTSPNAPGVPAVPLAPGAGPAPPTNVGPAVPLAPGGQPANAPGTPAVPFGAPGAMPTPPNAPGEPAVPFAAGAPPAPPAPAFPPSPVSPAALQATGAASAQAPTAAATQRIVQNLVSGDPASTAGVSRETLGELYRNPLTRNVATAFLQKIVEPTAWSYHFNDETGRVTATSPRGDVKDVTPGGTGAAGPMSKQEAEMQGYYKGAIAQGFNEDQAHAIAVNKGKLPSEDLHPDERKAVIDFTKEAENGKRVLNNLEQLKQISPKAWGFPGATEAAPYVTGYLPKAITPEGAVQVQDLTNAARSNVANMAKTVFGARLAVAEVKLLDELESTGNQSDTVRQNIYTRATQMIKDKIQEALDDANRIRNKTMFKPGGGAPGAAPPATVGAPSGGRPSLGSIFGGS